MTVAAGEKGIARCEFVDEAVFEQKIERPVDRNGRRSLAGRLRHPIDHLIGAERAALAGQNFENTPPSGRQAYFVAAAERQRGGEGPPIARTLRVAGPGKLFPACST